MSAPNIDALLASARETVRQSEASRLRELRTLARRVLDGEIETPDWLAIKLGDLRATVEELEPEIERVRQVRRLAKRASQLEEAERAKQRANEARLRVEAEVKAEQKRLDERLAEAHRAWTGANSRASDAAVAWNKLLRLVPPVALERLRAVQAERAPIAERVDRAQREAGALAVQPSGQRTADRLRERLRFFRSQAETQSRPGFASGAYDYDYGPEIARARRELEEHEAVLADVGRLPELEAQLAALDAQVAREQAAVLEAVDEAEGPGGEGLPVVVEGPTDDAIREAGRRLAKANR